MEVGRDLSPARFAENYPSPPRVVSDETGGIEASQESQRPTIFIRAQSYSNFFPQSRHTT